MSHVPGADRGASSRLDAERPTLRHLRRWIGEVYRHAYASGHGRGTAIAFAALHVVQRVSYYAGWRAATIRRTAT